MAKYSFNPEAAAFRPVPSSSAPAIAETGYKPRQVMSFLDLPFEVREMIYDQLLRPDLYSFNDCDYQARSRNAVGCTSILLLNRQTYSEAIAVIQTMSNSIVLKGSGRKVFRHPLANGKPSFFHSYARCSTTFVPESLSELEFINLRKVTVVLFEYTARIDVAEIFGAIKKSQSLKHIEFNCQVCTAEQGRRRAPRVSTDWAKVKQIKNAIRPLIHYCMERRIKVTAIENNHFKNSYLVHGAPRAFYVDNYRDPLVKHIDDFAPLQQSNLAIDRAAAEAETTDNQQDSPRGFKLTPECRHCYALFATTDELKHHLSAYPQHAIPFAKKKYNCIHPLAKAGGDRHACLVCGRNYDSENFLGKHIEKYGHQRDRKEQGVVPRFVRDNHWYKCTGGLSSMDEE